MLRVVAIDKSALNVPFNGEEYLQFSQHVSGRADDRDHGLRFRRQSLIRRQNDKRFHAATISEVQRRS